MGTLIGSFTMAQDDILITQPLLAPLRAQPVTNRDGVESNLLTEINGVFNVLSMSARNWGNPQPFGYEAKDWFDAGKQNKMGIDEAARVSKVLSEALLVGMGYAKEGGVTLGDFTAGLKDADALLASGADKPARFYKNVIAQALPVLEKIRQTAPDTSISPRINQSGNGMSR